MTSTILTALQHLDDCRFVHAPSIPGVPRIRDVPHTATVLVTCTGLMKILAPRISRAAPNTTAHGDPHGQKPSVLKLAARCKATFYLTRELNVKPLNSSDTRSDVELMTGLISEMQQLGSARFAGIVLDDPSAADEFWSVIESKAQTLEELEFRYSYFYEDMPSLARAVSKLRNVRHLIVSSHGDAGCQNRLFEALVAGPGTSLREFRLCDNIGQLGGAVEAILNRFVDGCPNLTSLNLTFEQSYALTASSRHFNTLRCISQLHYLSKLALSWEACNLFAVAPNGSWKFASSEDLAACLQQMPLLEDLELNSDEPEAAFSDEIALGFVNGLPRNGLKRLSLTFYSFSPRAVPLLCESFVGLVDLYLYSTRRDLAAACVVATLPPHVESLEFNGLGIESAASLAKAFEATVRHQKLRICYLRQEKPLSGTDAEQAELIHQIASLPLQRLTLDRHFICEGVEKELPRLGATLTHLHLDGCLSIVSADAFLRAVCSSCQRLTSLSLYNLATLTDAGLELLPLLGKCLTHFQLEGACRVTSRIFAEMAQCKQLDSIDLHGLESEVLHSVDWAALVAMLLQLPFLTMCTLSESLREARQHQLITTWPLVQFSFW